MSTHSRPTLETDALIHKINADMDAAEAAGTELSADVPMREMIDHARRLEQQRDECVEALAKLSNEVYACLGMSGAEMVLRHALGNTNYTCLEQRTHEARATLARIREAKP